MTINFAHAPTVVLSVHVQNFVAIRKAQIALDSQPAEI